ncbi:hypothetical protein ABIF66_001578 [Bradyrhizobium japonicum]
MIEALQKLAPWLVDLPPIPKAILSVLIVVLAAFCLAVLWQPSKKGDAGLSPPTPGSPFSIWAEGRWPKTGDYEIDQTIDRVNRLKAATNPSDSEVISALQPIFQKPIFAHLAEEPNPGMALFIFCKAEQLLTVYAGKISAPSLRGAFGTARQNLISLQDRLAVLYGPGFRRDYHCSNYSSTVHDYLSHLPDRIQDRLVDQDFYSANDRLQNLRSLLKQVGLRLT